MRAVKVIDIVNPKSPNAFAQYPHIWLCSCVWSLKRSSAIFKSVHLGLTGSSVCIAELQENKRQNTITPLLLSFPCKEDFVVSSRHELFKPHRLRYQCGMLDMFYTPTI